MQQIIVEIKGADSDSGTTVALRHNGSADANPSQARIFGFILGELKNIMRRAPGLVVESTAQDPDRAIREVQTGIDIFKAGGGIPPLKLSDEERLTLEWVTIVQYRPSPIESAIAILQPIGQLISAIHDDDWAIISAAVAARRDGLDGFELERHEGWAQLFDYLSEVRVMIKKQLYREGP